MYFPLKNPNLPESKVTVAAVSEYADDSLFDKLNELKIEVIKTKNNAEVNLIGYHADLSMLNYAHSELIIDESQNSNIVNFLTKGYRYKICKKIKSPYPDDSKLNCVMIGDKIICNPKSVDKYILSYCNSLSIKIIPVNQGYTKCSVCVVGLNALISDDESIHRSCLDNQIDSILISKGSIELNGFEYGFIGGCSGLIDKNKLLFNGDINYHKDCNLILDFLNRYNIEPIIIPNKPLRDIGSIIPLCEKHCI